MLSCAEDWIITPLSQSERERLTRFFEEWLARKAEPPTLAPTPRAPRDTTAHPKE